MKVVSFANVDNRLVKKTLAVDRLEYRSEPARAKAQMKMELVSEIGIVSRKRWIESCHRPHYTSYNFGQLATISNNLTLL